MTTPADVTVTEMDLEALAGFEGQVAIFVGAEGRLDAAARRVNRLTRGAVARLVASKAFSEARPGTALPIAFPCGMSAEAVQVVRLDARPDAQTARKAGVALGAAKRRRPLLVALGNRRHADSLVLGVLLRAYAYEEMKSQPPSEPEGPVRVMAARPEALDAALARLRAVADGVFFTRDLVNAPANVLTTETFAERLRALEALGVKVEVLDEDALEALGMRALLAVGQGSASPSKVVVMQWQGGAPEAAPLALIGKGVVFDTGGISIKPAQNMEEMTMDMGGAGVVAGVMKTLALRGAKANVVGLVGLVENMPSGTAQRPGDVVRTMKGDTVEVINTDAEGRLVLADVLWYAQQRFKPAGIVDLATLTGAIIIALGHEKAGVFANDDELAAAFLRAAEREGEGAWRMPLAPAYDEQLKSDIADMKNVGGRPAGAVTAAQFLQRFVAEGTPWVHLDIAGVARTKADGAHWPKGASGWGVLALDRLVAERFER